MPRYILITDNPYGGDVDPPRRVRLIGPFEPTTERLFPWLDWIAKHQESATTWDWTVVDLDTPVVPVIVPVIAP